MALAVPKLDDRSFQDIVDEAKKRIPYHLKEWTDHNVSDPGITLIELFAWIADILLYRMNQVPDLHYIKFMEMLGIKLLGPAPAKTAVTFWLSAPQPQPVLIPAGTQVSSTQTETEQPVVFTTDAAFRVTPPQLNAVISRIASSDGSKKAYREANLRNLQAGFEGFNVFTNVPQVNDALYFGFENDLSHHILGFDLDFDSAGGVGIDPKFPPYIFEASTGLKEENWKTCWIEVDTTRGMNVPGRILIHLPKLGKYSVNNSTQFWVRSRVSEISPDEQKGGMRPYKLTPRLRKLAVAAWGAAIPATQAQVMTREYLGQSDGSPGQRFHLLNTPVLERTPDERLVSEVEGEPKKAWLEVGDFAGSGAEDRHFVLDSLSGELRFGPAVRQPDGTMKLYGAVPPRRAALFFERYRFGGGQDGNVQANILNTLKTAIPYIARVANLQPAWGGLDAETLEAARLRAPMMLRSGDRAVTESDYEFLARQALPVSIGKVKCLQPSPSASSAVVPGQIYVLVIPRVPKPEGYIDPDQLNLAEADVTALTAYLDERRLLTTRLSIRPPAYEWVAVSVQLHAAPGVDAARVEKDVLARLYRFINPLTGGPDGHGWPFGRTMFLSDVYGCLQGIPDVQFIRSVEMFKVKPGGGPSGNSDESIELVAHGVVASGRHLVEFV